MFRAVSFLLTLHLLIPGPLAFADEATSAQLDVLEKEAHEAYSGYDFEDFETKFEKLIKAYQNLKRPQEEAWAQLELGSEQEALKLEKQLRLRLRTESIIDDTSITEERLLIRKLVLESGIKAVFRPEVEGYSPRHDILYYELAREAGFGLVPVTTTRTHKGRNGSLQAFIEDLTPGDTDFRYQDYTDERLYALDFVSGFIDRHANNWGRRPGGGIVASDNDLIFGNAKQALAMINQSKRPSIIKSFEPPRIPISTTTLLGLRKLKKTLQNSENKFTSLVEPERRFFINQIDRLIDPNCEASLR